MTRFDLMMQLIRRIRHFRKEKDWDIVVVRLSQNVIIRLANSEKK